MMTSPATRVAIFTLLGCTLLTFAGCSETPEAGYNAFVQAAKNKNYNAAWDRIDKRSQGQLDGAMQLLRVPVVLKLTLSGNKTRADEIAAAGGRELFTLLLQEAPELEQKIANATSTVEAATVEGDQATLTVNNDGNTETVNMILEDGKWKLVLGGFK